MQLQLLAALAKIGATLPAFIVEVGTEIAGSAKDGKITPDEAEAIARAASSKHGDLLKIKVRGVDVVDADAQADLAAFIGRVTVRVVNALGA